ncbi:MAG: hypothetical protein ACE5Z5_03105 [Candidatus Bathyarchaeia archaeon]
MDAEDIKRENALLVKEVHFKFALLPNVQKIEGSLHAYNATFFTRNVIHGRKVSHRYL